MNVKIIVLAFVLVFISCSKDEIEIKDVRINHYKNTCLGIFGPRLCLQIQEEGEPNFNTDQWNYLYEGIDGFEYEQGYLYELTIKKEILENPPQDVSNIKYSLVELISKEKVNESFDLQLAISNQDDYYESFVTGNKNEGYKIVNTINVNCDILCDNLETELSNQTGIIGVFEHEDENTINLIDYEVD